MLMRAYAPTMESGSDPSKGEAFKIFRGGVTPDNPVSIDSVEISEIASHGKNLFDHSKAMASGTINGVTLTNCGNGVFTLNGTSNATAFFPLYKISKPGTYHFYGMETNTNGIARIDVRNEAMNRLMIQDFDLGNKTPITFTVSSQPLMLAIRVEGGSAVSNVKIQPMLYQKGDGAYEPFAGSTISKEIVLRSLPDGTHDEFQNGKIFRRVGKKVLTGAEEWRLQLDGGIARFFTTLNNTKKAIDYQNTLMCDSLPIWLRHNHNSSVAPQSITGYGDASNTYPGQNWIYIMGFGSTASTVDAFKAWLATHPITILYPLETPTEETVDIPILKSKAPYVSVAHDSPVSTDIDFEILTKSDYMADIADIKERLAALESAALE